MYDSNRYFVMTGAHLPGTPATVEERQAALDAFYARTFTAVQNGHHAPAPQSTQRASLSDEEVIERARSSRNGAKFLALWGGDTREYAGDDSAADLALLSMLSFWTQDPAQLDRLFRRSGLMREKWERADYRERTIQRALDRSEVWEPGPRPITHGMTAHEADHAGAPPFVEMPPPRKVAAIPWPVLDEAALYGLPGDVVRAVDPHTEGDPAATLINYLVMFGAAVGTRPHALVGDTSKGRKGTSHDTPQAIVQAAAADSDWDRRVQGGLDSGKGVI
jgi:hypothetical protein